jgi:ABC-type amino acid transport/signal transduction systems, periplasmic component/domain
MICFNKAAAAAIMDRIIISDIGRKLASAKNIISFLAGLGLALMCGATSLAQEVTIPGLWDPNAPPDRPELAGQGTVRFLTDDSFPPLHFAGIDRIPTGFSVELARAACERLQITCTIQTRQFDTLLDALNNRQGDAIAAAIPITARLRSGYAVTLPYFRNPARFASLRMHAGKSLSPEVLRGKNVGVVEGTFHEAYLRRFFPDIKVTLFPGLAAAEASLKAGTIEYLFADGLNLALWLGGTEADGCCSFTGGPYLESSYFGEGIGLVFRADDTALRNAFDYALFQLWKEGRYAELYLRFFPVSPY